MQDIQALKDILEMLEKQDEMVQMLEEQQDEIDALEQRLSTLTQDLSDSREQIMREQEAAKQYRLELYATNKRLSQTREELDESLSLNEDLSEENCRLNDLLTSSGTQNQRLQIQIDSLKNLQE